MSVRERAWSLATWYTPERVAGYRAQYTKLFDEENNHGK
jgi:hypothetical protein